MVYHEVRKQNGESYHYLVKNRRIGNRSKKFSKYIGKGKISQAELQQKKEEFIVEGYHYLEKEDCVAIEEIKHRFNTYLEKGGKSGQEQFKKWYFTELTYNSNAIEGNSLTLRETALILNEKIIPKDSDLREVYETKNHQQAIELLERCNGDLNEELIKKIHRYILTDIDNKNAGKYREIKVFVTGEDVIFPSSQAVPKLMKGLIKWYKENKSTLHPLELAAITSMKFVSIHPFVDGNGRVSRLIMNFLLKKHQYPEINVYMKQRNNYLHSVRQANDEKYELIIDFLIKILKLNYAFLREEDTHK
ncbi:Fic family protein [Candidatus Woesearchaeota archaeon]|nr:Fic family protein [Candidatus Woesearchaeota archaeon]